MNDIDDLIESARDDFESATTAAELENAKAKYLGKSGRLTVLLKSLASATDEERRTRGALINAARRAIEDALESRREALKASQLLASLQAQSVDVTLPGRRHRRGAMHPISRTTARIERILGSMGFDVADGPEIESDWYSFGALNNPENHPARSMQDTFYVDLVDEAGRPLNLRPHTSPMQVRYAQAHVRRYADREVMPDIRVIAPGRTYRVDNDATHSPMFHQVEGLWIGEAVSFRDLKAFYLAFIRTFFETDQLELRFRPSYFPFTEPSAEIDIRFTSGPLEGRWLEVSGAGQVHPQVVRHMGIDPERYIGFAFGSGIDRLAMLRYGVTDLRQFFDGDLRFLGQFQ